MAPTQLCVHCFSFVAVACNTSLHQNSSVHTGTMLLEISCLQLYFKVRVVKQQLKKNLMQSRVWLMLHLGPKHLIQRIECQHNRY